MHEQIPFKNLDNTQALKKINTLGYNELPKSKKEGFWSYGSRLFKEPMLLILVAASAIYLVMGNLGEGLMLGVSVFFVIGISVYQERKSEKALSALRDLSAPRALVIRNDQEKRIPANQIVPGDLVVLNEGDRVPADGYILRASNLKIDESLLTGESFPVAKSQIVSSDESSVTENTESTFKVFSSTLVISGSAFIRITNTGINTEVGKIGKSLQEVEPEELNLAKEIQQIVRLFAWSGGIICVAITILYGMTHNDWLQAFLVGLATQMSLLPEEFPVVLAVFLAMGAWRMSKLNVLIRRPGSIERLGAATVLCVDKTGTLTENRMSVAALNNTKHTIYINKQNSHILSEDYHEVIEFGVLSSQINPFDPMERAIRRMVEENKWGKDHIHQEWELVRNYPLSNKLLVMSCVWKNNSLNSYIIAAKGAPEDIVDLCHLDSVLSEKIMKATQEMAKQGLRVLGVARATFSYTNLPTDQHEFEFKWLGLIGLEDPLRQEVPNAVELCRKAGIRVIMMTGDYPETALKIADKAGIETVNSLITGQELKTLTDFELSEKLKTTHVFARMVPEQKLRIVKLLKNLGHVVGMTGDGVNDAPSLKWADIGIAMGARGTDVAREASDIVLLDDNFRSIVSGVERGRLIFDNIRKAMSYIVSIHVSIAGLSILPVIFKWPLILLPAHIVFLELIIDPACSLMFESQESAKHIMKTPPRSLNARLFSARDLVRSLLQGLVVLGVTLSVLWYQSHINNLDQNKTRAFVFVVLVICNIGLIFADLSDGSLQQLSSVLKITTNQIIIFGITLGLVLITQIEVIRRLFYFDYLNFQEIIHLVLIGIIVFISIGLWNRLAKRQKVVY